MCWCRPEIRTPFCGRPACHPPEAIAEKSAAYVLAPLKKLIEEEREQSHRALRELLARQEEALAELRRLRAEVDEAGKIIHSAAWADLVRRAEATTK